MTKIGGEGELTDMIWDWLTTVEKTGRDEWFYTLAEFCHLEVEERGLMPRKKDTEGLEDTIVDVVGIEAAQQEVVDRDVSEKGEELCIVERETDLETKELVDSGGIIDIRDIDIASHKILKDRPRGDTLRERAFETIGNEWAEILAATIFEIVVEECRDHVVERGIGTHDGSGQTGACGNIGAVARDEDCVGSDGIELAEAGDCV